jgi:hypothetical protein
MNSRRIATAVGPIVAGVIFVDAGHFPDWPADEPGYGPEHALAILPPHTDPAPAAPGPDFLPPLSTPGVTRLGLSYVIAKPASAPRL